ncbi:hypothetical protein [Cylindrospermum stagnale]|uniref:hypothetical protein n=1 Tax=Cylindrospermum stagnale TaxID=142864 RepID=UPI0002E421BB|nr:hypothetical protein [Cylindrospermum stagnale]
MLISEVISRFQDPEMFQYIHWKCDRMKALRWVIRTGYARSHSSDAFVNTT